MTISFITVTRNVVEAGRADALRRCVASVEACPVLHEHVIVDGASTDGTVELIKKIGGDNRCTAEGLSFVSERDTGIYDALNKGVRMAKGEWIHVLGCDDWICNPAAIEQVITKGEKVKADIIVTPAEKDGGGRTINLKSCLYSIPYCHQGVLMRKSLIERVGGFNAALKLAGDYELTLQAHLSGAKEIVLPTTFAHYSTGGASSGWTKLHAEVTDVARRQFGLTERETARFDKTRCLPVRILLPLLAHKRGMVRKAATWQLVRNVMTGMGLRK